MFHANVIYNYIYMCSEIINLLYNIVYLNGTNMERYKSFVFRWRAS